jgi:hypothetical protein
MADIKRVTLSKDMPCVKCGKTIKAGHIAVKDRSKNRELVREGKKAHTTYFHTVCP